MSWSTACSSLSDVWCYLQTLCVSADFFLSITDVFLSEEKEEAEEEEEEEEEEAKRTRRIRRSRKKMIKRWYDDEDDDHASIAHEAPEISSERVDVASCCTAWHPNIKRKPGKMIILQHPFPSACLDLMSNFSKREQFACESDPGTGIISSSFLGIYWERSR